VTVATRKKPAPDLARFALTDEEQACVSAKIKKLKDEGYEQDQAVAIAIKHCAPEKSKSAKGAAYGQGSSAPQTVTVSSSDTTAIQHPLVKINGANHRAIDTGDGFYVVPDVPVFSEIEKGVKGAPRDIDKAWLEEAVAINRKEYGQGSFTGPLHIGHNKAVELSDPAFAGYFTLKRVGPYVLDGEVKATIYADFKMTAAAFDLAKRAELPYVSVEIHDWDSNRIDSVSFLNSKPSYFHYALFTIGEIVKDESARFAAVLRAPAHFQDDDENGDKDKKPPAATDEKAPPHKEPDGDEGGQTAAHCCAHCAMYGEQISRMARIMGMSFGGKMEIKDEKPNATPVEQKREPPAPGATLQAEAQAAAKFAAMADKIAALEKDADGRKAEEAAKILEAKAVEDLKGFVLGESTKAGLAKFSRMGEDHLKAFVASVKEVGTKAPARTLAEYEQGSVAASDPAIAKFQQMGPDKLEKAAKFAAEHRRIKATPAGRGMQTTEEQYIEFRLKEEGR